MRISTRARWLSPPLQHPEQRVREEFEEEAAAAAAEEMVLMTCGHLDGRRKDPQTKLKIGSTKLFFVCTVQRRDLSGRARGGKNSNWTCVSNLQLE
jgi:hypothetical protein